MALHQTDEAIKLLTEISKHGYRKAMLALGDIYYLGQGTEMDTAQAIYWLRQAAAKGSLTAFRNLGKIYYSMGSDPENDRRA